MGRHRCGHVHTCTYVLICMCRLKWKLSKVARIVYTYLFLCCNNSAIPTVATIIYYSTGVCAFSLTSACTCIRSSSGFYVQNLSENESLKLCV